MITDVTTIVDATKVKLFEAHAGIIFSSAFSFLVTKGIATRSEKQLVAPGVSTSNKGHCF